MPPPDRRQAARSCARPCTCWLIVWPASIGQRLVRVRPRRRLSVARSARAGPAPSARHGLARRDAAASELAGDHRRSIRDQVRRGDRPTAARAIQVLRPVIARHGTAESPQRRATGGGLGEATLRPTGGAGRRRVRRRRGCAGRRRRARRDGDALADGDALGEADGLPTATRMRSGCRLRRGRGRRRRASEAAAAEQQAVEQDHDEDATVPTTNAFETVLARGPRSRTASALELDAAVRRRRDVFGRRRRSPRLAATATARLARLDSARRLGSTSSSLGARGSSASIGSGSRSARARPRSSRLGLGLRCGSLGLRLGRGFGLGAASASMSAASRARPAARRARPRVVRSPVCVTPGACGRRSAPRRGRQCTQAMRRRQASRTAGTNQPGQAGRHRDQPEDRDDRRDADDLASTPPTPIASVIAPKTSANRKPTTRPMSRPASAPGTASGSG